MTDGQIDCSVTWALWLWWDPDQSKAEQDHAEVGTGHQTAPGVGTRQREMQHAGKNQLLRGCSFNLPHLLHLVPQSCSKTEQATAEPVCFPTCKLKMQKKIFNSSCALSCTMFWVVLLLAVL